MDNIAGSVAQQGAPDSQMQLYTKSPYDFNELAWLVIQSRDFGRTQLPLITDGFSYVSPPSDMNVPEFKEYLKQELADRGGRPAKTPDLAIKITQELEMNPTGMTVSQLADKLNSNYQNTARAMHSLINTEIVRAIPINGNTNKFVLNRDRGILIKPLPDLL
jgi:hypothetical protein